VVDEGFSNEGSISVGVEGHFEHGVVELLRPQEDLLLHPPAREAGPAALGTVLCITCPWLLPFASRFVKPGQIATCKEITGTARVIPEGFHFANVLGAAEIKIHDANAQRIEHGPLHIIRVPPGFVGLATSNAQPLLLAAGRHVVNDPLFVWNKMSSLTHHHITNVSVHIITVPAAQLCTCMVNGVGHFLGEGVHRINNPRFVMTAFFKATKAHIEVGKKHRFVLEYGICTSKNDVYTTLTFNLHFHPNYTYTFLSRTPSSLSEYWFRPVSSRSAGEQDHRSSWNREAHRTTSTMHFSLSRNLWTSTSV
jgi:hypothetical protein|tara:strand:- start:522 stop:1448 length:927 start_codon:yes stop_codon:yes gene_type:complete